MELTVLERLVLLQLLPKEGNFATLKLVRKAREDLSFDDLENKRLNFVQDGDQVRWNMTEDKGIRKDITIGETMTNTVVEELKKLSDSGKLREDHFTLYEKFVEGIAADPAAESA